MASKRFTTDEQAAIKAARTANPTMSQRSLAKTTYDQYNTDGTPGFALKNRSQASIYSAIRSHDRSNKSGKSGKAKVGA